MGLLRHLLAAVLILLVPPFIADHSAALLEHIEYQAQIGLFALAYLVAAWILDRRGRERPVRVADVLAVSLAALCPAVIATALYERIDIGVVSVNAFARRDLAVAAILVLGLSVLSSGVISSRARSAVTAAVFTVAALATSVGLYLQYRGLMPGTRMHDRITSRITQKLVDAPFYTLQMKRYQNFITPPRSLGGGLTRLGNGELLATGDGDLYDLQPQAAVDTLAIRKLAIRVPLNTDDLIADHRPEMEINTFRVTDILVRQSGSGTTLFAAHHYWHRDQKCFGLRLSALDVPAADAFMKLPAATTWRTVYETQPCMKPEGVLRTPYTGFVEAGGRLAVVDADHLLLTIGEHEFDGVHSPQMPSQDPASMYGKILLVDVRAGTASVYSSGHRDPQGLFVTDNSTVWSTEHGPQGGDELNLIQQGHNYGWPRVTLGTDYGRNVWPLNDHQGAHEGYDAPFFAWTPGIGISNLIQISGEAFPLWRGDLLVGALKGRALWRVRIQDGRVLYAAAIPLGLPVRDVEQDAQGDLIVWTDRDIVTLTPARVTLRGELHAAACLACHTLYPDRTEHGSGPNLVGIIGRRVASAPGFAYSEALRNLGGSWDRSRLDAFLADPTHIAPGNQMRFGGITSSTEREDIINFLETRSR